MKTYLVLIPAAAAAVIAAPLATIGHSSRADASQTVEPELLAAAVDYAEAERRAAVPLKSAPADAAANLDRMSGAAERVDLNRIDPKIALGALAR